MSKTREFRVKRGGDGALATPVSTSCRSYTCPVFDRVERPTERFAAAAPEVSHRHARTGTRDYVVEHIVLVTFTLKTDESAIVCVDNVFITRIVSIKPYLRIKRPRETIIIRTKKK